jgi:hypothetical protein
MRRLPHATIWVLVLVFGADGCGGDDGNDCPDQVRASCEEQVAAGQLPEAQRATCEADGLRTCATSYYFGSFSARAVADCTLGTTVPIIDKIVDTTLFRGSGVGDGTLAVHTRALQRYFEPNKLRFQTAGVARSVDIDHVMTGSIEAFNTALTAAGLPPLTQVTPDQQQRAEEVVAETMLRPLREFLAAHGTVVQDGHVNMVVVRQIVSPELAGLLQLPGEIAGLGLSPLVLQRVSTSDPQGDLYRLLDLPAAFTPTLFIGHEPIDRLVGDAYNIVAHEMGHTLGLPHDETPGNLMVQAGRQDCRAYLTQAQADMMGPFAGLLGGSPEAGMPEIGRLLRRALDQALVANLGR